MLRDISPAGTDFKIVCVPDPGEALSLAGSRLRSDPVRHNYILTLLESRLRLRQTEKFWIIYLADEVYGVAAASPDRPLYLPRMNEAGLSALSVFLRESGEALYGVFGEAGAAARFAGLWTEQHDLSARPVDALRLYIHRTAGQKVKGSGDLITATVEDTDEAVRMTQEYFAEIGETSNDLAGLVERRIAEGTIFLWRADGKTRAMAGHFPAAAGVARIHTIYTPPEWRGLGYGRDALTRLTDRLTAEKVQCLAFAQLGNAASNYLYRYAGYRAGSELLRYEFDGSGS